MKTIKVKLGERSYDIIIGYNGLRELGKILKNLGIGRDAVVVTNEFLKKKYGRELEDSLRKRGFSVKFIVVPQDLKLKEKIKKGQQVEERIKTQGEFDRLIKTLAEYDSEKKRLFIVAFGGGVIGDLTGYASASYKRGIPYIHVPTTLLSQVDSSIGGKVGIDLPEGKNLLGTFYQPKLVFIDIKILKSLSVDNIRDGLSEVIKYGIIKDKRLFKYLESNYNRILKFAPKGLEHIIVTSAQIKAKIVEADEYDKKGKRVILNYGHTIGHAIEAAVRYCGYYGRHGIAVGIGMLCAAEIARELSILNRSELERIERLIKNVGLPVKIRGIELSKILEAQSRDKKFIHGRNRFVLPAEIGKVIIREGIPVKIIEGVLKKRMG